MPYSASQVRSRDRILRVLLVGPPKSGKTVASVKTVPGPVFVMNTDGQGGLDPVASMGGEFVAEDVTGLSSFEKALLYFKQHINEFESLVLDNITSLSQTFERETREQAPGNSDGRTIYPEYTRRLVKAFDQLLALPRHLIILGHTEEPQGDQGPGNFGHVLGISGRARTIIPMKMQDWICMHAESKPGGGCIYQFLLAPTGNWNKGVRSIQGAKRMPADFCKFIDIMSNGGIAPKALEEQGTAFEPVASKKPQTKPQQQQQVRR